jgi:putative phosphoserine phosphatase/1-acylglycerol-3-phosphate O-acyltransferase
MLRIGGVKLRIEPELQARLFDRKTRVLVFNHSSTLDTFVCSALLPPGGVPILKSEFLWIPLMGLAAWSVGSIFVNRSQGEKARASLARAVARMQAEKLQIMIAPEGTRVAGPELGRFKLGAFRLAREAGISVQPFVLHHCQSIWPLDAFAPTDGTAVLTVLDPVSVEGADEAQLRVIADATREAMVAAMATQPLTASQPVGPAV